MRLAPENQVALEALRAACRVCRAVAAGSFDAVRKADASPVTIADFASQAVIVARLRAHLGEPVIIGEESADELRGDLDRLDAVVAAARVAWPEADRDGVLAAIDAGAQRPTHGPYWTLDPIDGTKGFVRREQYAVCLARVDGDAPVVGLLGCPNLPRDPSRGVDRADAEGSVYVVEAQGPVFELGVDDDAAREVPRVEAIGDPCWPEGDEIIATVSVESGHTKLDHVDAILRHLGRPSRTIRCDSQAKYALVARGQAHVYLRVPTDPTRVELVWDHAAGAAIAARTGMRVTDLRGAALDFSTPPRLARNVGILCAHPGIHGELVDAIAALGFV
jgi:3'(2'), 5'-bisphosphate nucleotidase